jgi:hypothetical protein
MTNIVECEPEALSIGMPLEVTFSALDDVVHAPVFRPA